MNYHSISSSDETSSPPPRVASPQRQRSNDEANKKMFLFGCCVAVVCAFSVTWLLPFESTTSSGISMTSDLVPLLGQQPEPMSLSSRGAEIKPLENLKVVLAAMEEAYDPVDNKDGYLIMITAENKLMWKEMAAKIKQETQGPFPEYMFGYGAMGGQDDFKASVARVMERWIPATVDPDYLRFQAGAGSVLSCLSWLLANPDDGVLVTAPNYAAFAMDFGTYGSVKLHVAPTKASNGFIPTVQDLDGAFDRAVAAGNPPKIFIICQPNNPTGTIYPAETMELMISWALSKGLHVVSDEIYALSVFPGYQTTSATQIMVERNPSTELYLGDHVHIVAGMSKDWGISGFRVGSLFTHNAQLLQAMDTLGYYQSVSEYTQYALMKVFQDDAWVDWYIAENQRRLAETFAALEDAMSLIDVPLFPSKGGLFAWADFSSFLLEGQLEEDLWLELYTGPKVLFTPGQGCNEDKPGMLRIVYPWPEGGVEAVKELGRRLVEWKDQRSSP